MNKDFIYIEGGIPLKGEVKVQGAKNSALPLFASMIVMEGKTEFLNIPYVEDVKTMISLLSYLGLKVTLVEEDDKVIIENNGIRNSSMPLSFIQKMRASIYVLGPLLVTEGKAKVGIPGGCAFGPRPINFHLKGLKKIGAEIDIEGGYIIARVKKFRGAKITFPKVSVGATAHLAMTAAKIEEEIILENISLEPEVIHLFEFLRKAGAKIEVEKRRAFIWGNRNLKAPVSFFNIPDRIEAGTYMMFVSGTGGELILRPNPYNFLESVIKKLKKMGIYIENKVDHLYLRSQKDIDLRPVNVSTAPYPGYPTDCQPQIVSLLTQARGKSIVKERIYPERFGFVGELTKMGANIEVGHGYAKVEGKTNLKGAPLFAPDIRAGAALILGALVADGRSQIYGLENIKRGYENIVDKLKKLGAKIDLIHGRGS
ncbi:MAG: UDP-N-acetylglucosamine 1-carboxyvinyltransferase [Candidatus Hydrothermales bacterium]